MKKLELKNWFVKEFPEEVKDREENGMNFESSRGTIGPINQMSPETPGQVENDLSFNNLVTMFA